MDSDNNLRKIKAVVIDSERSKHDFEKLSKKIIGAAIEVHIDIHFAQLRSYLKATGLKTGLLLNFARPTLEIKRVVN